MMQYKKALAALFLVWNTGTTHAMLTSDTLYINQSVGGHVIVNVDGTIIARSDTVKSAGKLILVGRQGVTLQNNIDVRLGGAMIIQTGTPSRIIYTYDASGNRVRREKNTQ